ncbi:MAG: flagellar basal-body rod protein FlgG [Proteobacteria bacterium]|nr:flagellar basal-body rod protein FlgG [Pseudomonadota bacterium]
MMSALWVSKTGLSAQDMALHTISNNLANVSTIGFKRDRAVFEDLLYQVLQQPGAQSSQDTTLPSGLQLGTGVRIAGTQKMFGIGGMQTTDAPLDLAVEGRGFFQITMPDGSISYTRDGQFRMDQDGQIVNSQGHPLQPAISIPPDADTITIGTDGTVTVMTRGNPAATQVGTVELVNFVNPAGLQANGSNLFSETPASGSPQSGTAGTNGLGHVLQGTLETSNVSVVEELVNMVSVQRAYEMNSKVVSTSDQMLQYITQNV